MACVASSRCYARTSEQHMRARLIMSLCMQGISNKIDDVTITIDETMILEIKVMI